MTPEKKKRSKKSGYVVKSEMKVVYALAFASY